MDASHEYRRQIDAESQLDAPEWAAGARCVAHMDLDSFYASVEQREDPAIADKPIAVVMGLDEQGHGAVASASYAARALGVRSAQSLVAARRLCPNLIALPVRRALYGAYSARVMAVLHGISGTFQQISIDEAFVQLGGLAQSWPALISARSAIFHEIGLPCSFGIGPNKLVAKIATNQGKPRGLVVVPPGTQARFLAPLPVGVLWGVGPRTAERLNGLGLATLGELAARDPRDLAETFGPRRATELHEYAMGVDDSPLVGGRTYKSISCEQTFGRGETNARRLWVLLQGMASELAVRLEAQGLVARTVGIKLRLEDWRLLTRDRTLPEQFDSAERIAVVAADLMREHWRREPIRLFGLRVSGLMPKPAPAQQPLFPLLTSGITAQFRRRD